MKRLSVVYLLLILLLCGGFEAQAGSRKEREPKDGKQGWSVKRVDGKKLVWYSFRGEKFGAQQFVNVLSLDMNSSDYEIEFVALDRGDSLSSVAISRDAVAGINAAYESSATFIKTNGKVYSDISIPPGHLRYWKHEGAVMLDGDVVSIGFGTRDSYLKSDSPNIFSSSPMLIDDYKAVGLDFVGDVSDIDITKLAYEDYRRHQGVRHPRTAVALTQSNRLLLITVDGRSKNSAGMSAKELTEFICEYFNPRYALNMDGGGSTTMYIKDSGESLTDVVNYPTDNKRYDHYGQRRVGTHILIKRKK